MSTVSLPSHQKNFTRKTLPKFSSFSLFLFKPFRHFFRVPPALKVLNKKIHFNVQQAFIIYKRVDYWIFYWILLNRLFQGLNKNSILPGDEITFHFQHHSQDSQAVMAISELLLNQAVNGSLQGFRHMFSSNYYRWRVTWMLLTLSSILICSRYLYITIVEHLVERPTDTRMEFRFRDKQFFPSVTFCPSMVDARSVNQSIRSPMSEMISLLLFVAFNPLYTDVRHHMSLERTGNASLETYKRIEKMWTKLAERFTETELASRG